MYVSGQSDPVVYPAFSERIMRNKQIVYLPCMMGPGLFNCCGQVMVLAVLPNQHAMYDEDCYPLYVMFYRDGYHGWIWNKDAVKIPDAHGH